MRREIIVLLMTCLILFCIWQEVCLQNKERFLVLAILSDIIIKKN